MCKLRKFVNMIQTIILDPAHHKESEARAAVQEAFDTSEFGTFAADFYQIFFHLHFEEDVPQPEAFELALKTSALSDVSDNKADLRGLGAAAIFLKEKSEDLHESIGQMLLSFGGRNGETTGQPELVPSWWRNRGLGLTYA